MTGPTASTGPAPVGPAAPGAAPRTATPDGAPADPPDDGTAPSPRAHGDARADRAQVHRGAGTPRARVYGTLRSAHLERAHATEPATILYRARRYDLDERLLDGLDVRHVPGARALVRELWRLQPRAVEVNEPLMLGSVLQGLLVVLTLAARDRLAPARTAVGADAPTGTRTRTTVVSYAIENLDPFGRSAPSPRAAVSRRVRELAARIVARRLDRLAFGTPGARDLYDRLLARELTGVTTTLVPALPSPCACPTPAPEHAAAPGPAAGTGPAEGPEHAVGPEHSVGSEHPVGPEDPVGPEHAAEPNPAEPAHRVEPGARPGSGTVLFLGALDRRKGVRDLLAAWPAVAAAVPGVQLVVVGTGPFRSEVEAVALERDDVRLVVDPPRSEVHAHLRRADVLVLLSQPTGTWREQVGLPLVEGLAHGCTVVTTPETGLASWLDEHGHVLVPVGAPPAQTAGAVVSALASARPPGDVLASLPAQDGRLAADAWLFAAS